MKIIGLSGKAGSGKDYIAHAYFAPLGYKVISLSWHIKMDMIAKGIVTYQDAFAVKSPQFRESIQRYGTKLGRDVYGEDVWINAMSAWMHTFKREWGFDKFVVTDVRFPNEFAHISTRMKGRVFRVHAPQRAGQTTLDEVARAHSSEIALDVVPLDRFDGVIPNDIDTAVDEQERVVQALIEKYSLHQ